MADHLDPDTDPFKPPPGSVLVHCIHCDEEYESFRIEWRVFEEADGKHGFWCCPIEGCDGKGFGFDIFPIDPEEAARFGIEICEDDDYEEEWDDEEDLDELFPRRRGCAAPEDAMPPDEDIPF